MGEQEEKVCAELLWGSGCLPGKRGEGFASSHLHKRLRGRFAENI